MEGVRAGGDPRPARQLRGGLRHREHRPDGRAHGRLDHRRAVHDTAGQGIPADARRGHRHHAGDRRGHRRVQRAVRVRPGQRRHGRHRDEPARVAQLRTGFQGHGLPDRTGRRQARRGLHARRAAQRHHRDDLGVFRAVDRLCRDEDAPMDLREVPRGRRDAHHPDEVRRRGDVDRPHLQGEPPEGDPLDGGETVRLRPRPQRPLAHRPAQRRGGRGRRRRVRGHLADPRGDARPQAQRPQPGAAVLHPVRLEDGLVDRAHRRADAHRSVVPRPVPAARGVRDRAVRVREAGGRPARGHAPCQDPRLLRSATGEPVPGDHLHRDDPAGAPPPQEHGNRAGVQAGGYLCRRVRGGDAVLLLDVRGGVQHARHRGADHG